jgi:hypothetical protein
VLLHRGHTVVFAAEWLWEGKLAPFNAIIAEHQPDVLAEDNVIRRE